MLHMYCIHVHECVMFMASPMSEPTSGSPHSNLPSHELLDLAAPVSPGPFIKNGKEQRKNTP